MYLSASTVTCVIDLWYLIILRGNLREVLICISLITKSVRHFLKFLNHLNEFSVLICIPFFRNWIVFLIFNYFSFWIILDIISIRYVGEKMLFHSIHCCSSKYQCPLPLKLFLFCWVFMWYVYCGSCDLVKWVGINVPYVPIVWSNLWEFCH